MKKKLQIILVIIIAIIILFASPNYIFAANPDGYQSYTAGNCSAIVGWVCDPDSPNTSLQIDFWDTTTGGFLGSAWASSFWDAGSSVACGGTSPKNYGYTFTLPDSVKTGTAHVVTAYGISVNSSGVRDNLNNTALRIDGTNSINCSPPPTPTPTSAPTATPAPVNNCNNTNILSNNPIRIPTGFLSARPIENATDHRFFTSNYCILSTSATIPSLSIPTYDEMKAIYYDKNQASNVYKQPSISEGNKTWADIQTNITACNGDTNKTSCLIYIKRLPNSDPGNLTIQTNVNSNDISKPTVIFIDGNLLMDTQNNKFEPGDNSSGVVFVVQGNINIRSTMGGANKSINAFFITYGTFCSSFTTSNQCISVGSTPLTINGSVISLGTNPPKFVRSLADNNTGPAETVIYQPKYLVILKNIFSKTLTIWKEIQ